MTQSPMNQDAFQEAYERLGDGYLVVVTGAGISLASGIPTFRGTDKDAVWKRDVTELATYRYFREDPVGSWSWYLERFSTIQGKKPNPAHEAIVDLERLHKERGGRFLLVTQNIDTLHEKAGSQDMVEVHGTAGRLRCASHGCRNGAPSGYLLRDDYRQKIEAFQADPSEETLPRCPECGDALRQHVLWFDEFYNEHVHYQWERVQDAAQNMDLALFVGTSFAVGVTELFLQSSVMRRVPAFSIDPSENPPPYPGIEMIREKAEEYLPRLCDALATSD